MSTKVFRPTQLDLSMGRGGSWMDRYYQPPAHKIDIDPTFLHNLHEPGLVTDAHSGENGTNGLPRGIKLDDMGVQLAFIKPPAETFIGNYPVSPGAFLVDAGAHLILVETEGDFPMEINETGVIDE